MRVGIYETCGDSWSRRIDIEYDSKSEHDRVEADKLATRIIAPRIIPQSPAKLKFEPE